MFTQLFFLLLAIILMTLDTGSIIRIDPNTEIAFFAGLGAYFIFLTVSLLQIKLAKYLRKFLHVPFLIILTNIELLVFLILYHSSLESYRLFQFSNIQGIAIQTIPIAISLTFYLFGLGWSYYHLCQNSIIHTHKPLVYAYRQVQFLFPFCIPFLFFNFVLDGLNCFSFWVDLQKTNSWVAIISSAAINLILLFVTLLFMPFFMVYFWRCKPLPESPLLNRLENVCQHLNFKHSGIKLWTVMKHSITAGIIGIIPKFRYIMFTERLIQTFSSEEIEAILIHEIGHSRYRHLIYYPFILLGMLVLGALTVPFFADPIIHYFLDQHSAETGNFAMHVSLFVPYAILLWLYFRFVFGFFSRLFERQADLHIFEYPSLPAVHMIHALDHLGITSGYTHDQPSWHHFSIRERINFLNASIQQPQLIAIHHRKVKKYLIIYFISLFIAVATLITLNIWN